LASLGLAVRAAAPAALAPDLQAWRDANTVRLGVERDYGPFVFAAADGSAQGLSIDMLRLLQQRTGLRLAVASTAPLQALLADAQAQRLDLLTSLRPTTERAAYLAFTQPYVTVPAVLVVRAGGPAPTLDGLAGQPVAVGQGYAVEAVMRERHRQVAWQAVSDDVVALQGVAAGRYRAAVVDAASLAFIVAQHGLGSLQAVSQVGFDYTLSFAVRRDWPQLVALLNAGIQALSPAERQAVLDRWLATQAATPPRAPWLTRSAWALLALALLLVLARAWRRRRARQ
jgi:ABC-type amino acid transport substrate-binding protein